jgi:hypothetical protein
MNPFNTEILTTEQLDSDCLCYISIGRNPVKSSRIFLGHMHEEGVKRIAGHFMEDPEYYKKVKADRNITSSLKSRHAGKNLFFKSSPDSRELKEFIDMYEFASFEVAYHQLMAELSYLTIEAIMFVLAADDDTSNIYITGGFSDNQLFRNHIRDAFPAKLVFTSEIANASALGAALVISGEKHGLNLGLTPA